MCVCDTRAAQLAHLLLWRAQDVIFGTFEHAIKVEDRPPKARPDPKSTLWGAPAVDTALYMLLACGCVGVWARAAVAAARGDAPVAEPAALGYALLAGAGPVVLAACFQLPRHGLWDVARSFLGHGSGTVASSTAAGLLHLSLGTAFCCYPVAAACYLAF